MSRNDRLNFEEACKELQLSEEELEQKVAAGEIASVKEGDSLFFKREVIENYKKQAELSDPTVLISDEEINLLEDEDIGDIDFGIEIEEPAAEGEKPAAAAAKSLDLDGELDLLGVGEDAEAPVKAGAESAADETVLNLDGILEEDTEGTTPISGAEAGLLEEEPAGDETLLDTDILDLGEGEDTDTFELDTAEDTLLDATEEGTLLRGGGARVMQMKRKESHAAWTAVLAITALLLLPALGVLLSQAYWETIPDQEVVNRQDETYQWIDKYNFFRKPVEAIADLFK